MLLGRKRRGEDQLAEFPEFREQYESLLKGRGLATVESGVKPRTIKRQARRYSREMKRYGKWPTEKQHRVNSLMQYDESRVGLSSVIDNRRREIEWIVGSMTNGRRVRVFVGEYPHGSMNAQSIAVDHRGVLILVNNGLMMLIHQASKLVAKEIQGWPVEALPPPEHERRRTQELLAEIVIAYILYGSSTHAKRLPTLGGRRGSLSASLTASAEQFAIAHEYGHVLVGHLDPSTQPPNIQQLLDLREQRLRSPEFVKKSHAQEFEADRCAMAIAINARKFAANDRDRTVREVCAYAGACLLFGLEKLVEDTRSTLKLPTPNAGISSHPTPEARREHLRRFVQKEVPQLQEWGDQLAEWLAEITPGTVEHARYVLADPALRNSLRGPLTF